MAANYEKPIQSEMAGGIICGAALLAGDAERNIVEQGFGYADFAKTVPMNLDSIIDVASMTKVLATTTALLICRDRGMIDFDKPFTDYLDFRAELFEPVTIRELAAHVSGFSHQDRSSRQYDAGTGPEIMRNILSFPPLFPPRQHFEYTCWNFLLLGQVVEKITGQSMIEFCRREIFEPLAMRDTSLGVPVTDDPARLAQTFGTDQPGRISDFIAFRVYRDGGAAGNAGAFSSAHDLAKFCRCILNGGRCGNGKRLFSEAVFREITTCHTGDFKVKRSFGWILHDDFTPPAASDRVIYHSGWSGQTMFVDLAKQRFVIVLTTRNGDYEQARRTRFQIINELLV